MDVSNSKLLTAKTVKEYLATALILVHITNNEDNALNSAGLQRKMPESYFDTEDELCNDVWARYKVSGIYNNIVLKT